jgi:hypothetical protein
MSDPISGATQSQPPAQIRSAPQESPKPQAPPAAVPTDTVHLSSAAQAALQEATETQAQTAKEARGGDGQAVRLLARETAAKAGEAAKPTHVVA